MKLNTYSPDKRVTVKNETEADHYKEIAEDRFIMYQAFLKAGFDQDQAFALLRDINTAYASAMFER